MSSFFYRYWTRSPAQLAKSTYPDIVGKMQWRQKIELTLNGISSTALKHNAFAGAELMSHIVRFTGLLLLNAFIVRGRPVGGIQR